MLISYIRDRHKHSKIDHLSARVFCALGIVAIRLVCQPSERAFDKAKARRVQCALSFKRNLTIRQQKCLRRNEASPIPASLLTARTRIPAWATSILRAG